MPIALEKFDCVSRYVQGELFGLARTRRTRGGRGFWVLSASSPPPAVAIVLVDACRYFENGWTQQLFNRMYALWRSGLSTIVRRARNADGQARSLSKAVGIDLKTKGLTRSRPTWHLAREGLKERVNFGCWIFSKIVSGSVRSVAAD